MCDLLGHAVRFGQAHDVMTAGEGIETILSLRMVLPHLPAAAALSAAHLSAILFPATLRRLYIARDDDPAGDGAMTTLIERARAVGIEAISLSPRLGTSTRISAYSAPMRYVQPCGFRSPRRMSRASSPCRSWPERRCEAGLVAGVMHRWRAFPLRSERAATTAFFRGRSGRQTARSGNGCARFFSAGPHGPLHREAKQPGFAVLRCASALSLRSGCRAGPPAVFRRHEGRGGRGRSDEGAPHEHRSRRHWLRTRTRLFPYRPRPLRTPALRLPPLPGRTRPKAAPRRQHRRRRHRRHLRRPDRHPRRHPPPTRPRRPALVARQPFLPPHRPTPTPTPPQCTGDRK